MIIATSNEIFETTPTLVSGSTTDDVANITTSNFSQNITVSGSIIEIEFGTATGSYLALHGLSFSDAPRGTPITVTASSSAGTIETFDINSGFSDVFFYFAESTYTNLTIRFDGSFGDLTISYAAAGMATVVPYGGAKPGQILPYLQNNYKTKANENSIGAPMSQRLRKVSTQVNINLNNMPIEWVRGDLKEVFDLFNKTQVVSMRDFESEDFPTEAWAGFQLKQTRASTYSGTRKLVSVPLSFRAASDSSGYYD